MTEKNADTIIESYNNDKNDRLLKQIESLKPKPFSWLISYVVVVVSVFLLQYFTSINVFEGDYYLILMVIVIMLTSDVTGSSRIDKRIDLLTKLVKNNAFPNRNI